MKRYMLKCVALLLAGVVYAQQPQESADTSKKMEGVNTFHKEAGKETIQLQEAISKFKDQYSSELLAIESASKKFNEQIQNSIKEIDAKIRALKTANNTVLEPLTANITAEIDADYGARIKTFLEELALKNGRTKNEFYYTDNVSELVRSYNAEEAASGKYDALIRGSYPCLPQRRYYINISPTVGRYGGRLDLDSIFKAYQNEISNFDSRRRVADSSAKQSRMQQISSLEQAKADLRAKPFILPADLDQLWQRYQFLHKQLDSAGAKQPEVSGVSDARGNSLKASVGMSETKLLAAKGEPLKKMQGPKMSIYQWSDIIVEITDGAVTAVRDATPTVKQEIGLIEAKYMGKLAAFNRQLKGSLTKEEYESKFELLSGEFRDIQPQMQSEQFRNECVRYLNAHFALRKLWNNQYSARGESFLVAKHETDPDVFSLVAEVPPEKRMKIKYVTWEQEYWVHDISPVVSVVRDIYWPRLLDVFLANMGLDAEGVQEMRQQYL